MAKKELLIEYDLEFLETKMQELKEYIEANPYSELKDRMAYKETKNGGMIPTVVANKETQRKDLTQALKDYAELLQTIRVLREVDHAKKSDPRGGQALSPIEKRLI